MLENLIEKIEQKSLTPYDMLLPIIAAGLSILFGLITWSYSIYKNYQDSEIIWFYSKLIISVIIISSVVILIIKFIRPPGDEEFDELKPLEEGPVGREKESNLLLNFLKGKSDSKNLLILTGDSGCGKTSFIIDGLKNDELKKHDNIPIRFDQYEDFHELIQKKFRKSIQNAITFTEKSLSSYVDIANSYGERPIFIFDQFEQLFIGGSRLKEEIIAEIQSVLSPKKDVKVVIVVRNESFKDTLMSFCNAAKLGCFEFCQGTQVIDLPLLNENETKEFLEWYLQPKGLFVDKTCQIVVDDLKKFGPANGKILPISLRIVSKMIAHKKISTPNEYEREGLCSGLQREYIQLILDNLKNSKVAPRVIFSLCEPTIGSVVLTDVEIGSIAQIRLSIIEKTRKEMFEKNLITNPSGKKYRIAHEYIGELFQEQGGKYISPIELQELQLRRKIKISQGIEVLKDDTPVILLEPTKGSRIFGVSIFLLGVIILLLRFFIPIKTTGGWIDLMFLPCFFVGMAIAVMSYNYHVNLLSRIWELENLPGKILSAFMAIVFLPAAIFLFIRPGWWPFVASSLAFFGAIKDLQISYRCKSSPSLKTTFRYWSASMGALSVTLLLIGFAFDSSRMDYYLVNIQHTNFILLSIAIILSSYILISAARFYSLLGLRPIISRINLEVPLPSVRKLILNER
jgi:Novel STAND NTPase 1